MTPRNADADPEERLTRALLELLSPNARLALLRVLTAPSEQRAEAIRGCYEAPTGRGMAELLMDLEADDMTRGLYIEVLGSLD